MNIEVWSPTIRRREMSAVLTAMVDERIGPGNGALEFASLAKEKLKFEYSLAFRSPATALREALKAFNLAAGDGVLISALSPLYYTAVLAELRLRSVFADVAESTACITEETLVKVTEDYKAAVIFHPLGMLNDVSFFAENGIPFVEDISAAFGTCAEQSAGEGQDNAPSKSCAAFTLLGLEERDMITAGGGALLYSSDKRNAAVLRNAAQLPGEYALPDMNAVMATVQLKECERNIEKRREIALVYRKAAQRGRHTLFASSEGYNHYAFALILQTGMKDVKQYAAKYGVAVEEAFLGTLAGAGFAAPEVCPAAYSLSLRTALFPLYPRLSAKSAEKVAKVISTLP